MLLLGPSHGLKHISRFAGLYVNRKMKQFFNRRMSSELAHSERWREGLSDRKAHELERFYGEIVDRIEADGIGCAPLLRRTLERSQAQPADRLRPVAFLAGDGRPVGGRL